MKPFQKLIKRNHAEEERETAAAGKNILTGQLVKYLIPVVAALAVAAIILNLGLTQFITRGYLSEDGLAVPQDSLSTMLREANTEENVSLLSVEMGDAIYKRLLASGDYFIGEEKKPVSAGYPLYVRNGQVLFFLDDSFKLVTSDWESLDSYDGLYLTDGVTYNANSNQADLDEIMMVEVENGYQVAQETKVSSSTRETTIAMNAICAFSESEIVYYALDGNTMRGDKVPMAEGATISIGENTFLYRDFLEKLGLWKEQPVKEPEQPGESEEPQKPERLEEDDPGVGQPAPQPDSDTETDVPDEPDEVDPVEKPEYIPQEPEAPQRPEAVTQEPAPPIENPDSVPRPPEYTPPTTPTNPDYKEPSVSFGVLQPWVYTLSSAAVVEDPSGALRNGGVQLYVYEIKEDGTESRVLRQTASSTGTVVIGQIKPSGNYHVVAEYEYRDANKRIVKKSIDLGNASTLPFEQLGSISFSLRDETDPYVREEDKVEIFSQSLQCRDFVFTNISNGTVVDQDSSAGATGANASLQKAEGYVNVLQMNAVDESGATYKLKMDSKTLRKLCSGYTISAWQTPNGLRTARQYTYTFEMGDRYGNVFTITPNKEQYSGHTCKLEPTVSIRVPGETNTVNSTQINVIFSNPELAVLGVDTSESALMKDLGYVAGMYLYKMDDPTKTPVPLKAYRVNAAGEHINASGAVVNNTDADTEGYYLPIDVNENNDPNSVTTRWVIKDLAPFATYTAAIVCGKYDIDDGKVHLSETLEKSENFTTVTLRSRVSYNAAVDQIGNNDARLKFRMNAADSVLLPIMEEIKFSLKKSSGSRVGSFTLRKTDLENCMIGAGAASGMRVAVPVQMEGKEEAVNVELELLWNDHLPELTGQPTQSVWDYILATSASDSQNDCWVAIHLGEPVFELEERTEYIGSFTTEAQLGGERIDITSSNSKDVKFRTVSEAASVDFENIFVADTFIEIFGLQINDGGNCIQEDVENRGGNVSLSIHEYLEGAVNPVGDVVSVTYIDSRDYTDPAEVSTRITGLSKSQKYVMIFRAQRYNDGSSTTPEQNRALEYVNPDENLQNAAWYVFQTGESISGDLMLQDVSQQYFGDDGTLTGTLSMLNPTDFYYGVLKDGGRVYYAEEEALESFAGELREKEIDLTESQLTKFAKDMDLNSTDRKYLSPWVTTSYKTENLWCTRFISVTPGEKYSIYDVDDMNYQRIIFYYSENDGPLIYYNQYYAAEYFRGGVFQVPSTTNAQNRKYYMCISGAYRQMANTLVLEKYDSAKTAQQPNLGEGCEIVKGMILGSTNGLSASETYGYVSDYIPGIVGGAVYELKGRDRNRADEDALLGANTTTGLVLFYDSNYAYIGSFNVSNQTALVKAPFGAAYCRFNVNMSKINDSFVVPSWEDKLSMRLYRNVATDRYSANMHMSLQDPSEAQTLKGGKYQITIYRTDSYMDESSDLAALESDEWTLWKEESWDVDRNYVGNLDIRRKLSYDDLPINRGFKATLSIQPAGWTNQVVLDTVYFTTNKVVSAITNLSELLSIRNNPAGSYVVVEDITGLTGSVLESNRPFTGTIDFQGHSVTTSSFSPLFYRISEGGVVKNLEVIYNAQSTSNSTATSCAPISYTNYGTIQNVVIRYNGHNSVYGADVYHSGGITVFNSASGVIDGFVVEFQKDVRVTQYFGGVCYSNSGSISNGYVTGVKLEEQGRRATVVHKYKNEDGQVIGSGTSRIALGVGYNATNGTVKNIFAVGDLIIESEQGETNPDITSTNVDTSVTGTNEAAVLVGRNRGLLENAFATGDRWDYGYDGNKSVMKQRGPAVGYVDGSYHAENISYFSDFDYETSTTNATIGTYNEHAENESLYDYQWHVDKLGADRSRFIIREMIEKDKGYYPQLVLPECFGADFVQPLIPLSDRNTGKVEILYNEVRVQGIDEALVTLSIANPYEEEVMGVNIYDDTHPSMPLNCEVLSQGSIGDSYQVDILISLQRDQEGYVMNDTQDKYTIQSVAFRSGHRTVSDRNGERYIHAEFWKEVSTIQDWMDYFSRNAMSAIKGNYLLTADLDFSESADSRDWFVNYQFKGKLNGGIYSTGDDAKKVLTDYKGSVLKDEEGNERTIDTFGALIGMHTISGVGNMAKDGSYNAKRNHGESTNSLFNNVSGTLENIVFRDFHSVNSTSITNNNTKSYRSGVIAYAAAGAEIDNCHVRDSNFYGRNCASGFIGDASGISVRNSSVANVKIEVLRINQGTDEIRAGGMIGYIYGSTVENCFASGVSVKAADVYNSNGMGGLIGYLQDTTVESCYATGTVDLGGGEKAEGIVDSSAARAGGIAGQMVGESELCGCWSTTTVMTAADFAGGIVGYHNGGILRNNYTAATLITRSLAATSVHRICNTIAFDEAARIDNFAFRGQYLTYVDPSAPDRGESLYQFGTWSELDGATRLLTVEELKQAGTWTNQIGFSDEAYDINGSASLIIWYDESKASSQGGTPFSGTQGIASAVSSGAMPKLKHTETGMLLYDQQGSEVGYNSDSVLSRIATTRQSGTKFHVKLALFTMREDLKALEGGVPAADKTLIADWENMSIVGGKVALTDGNTITENIKKITGGYNDAELSPTYGMGWQFEFDVDYGTEDGGHYLDSYILSLPVYTQNPYDAEGNKKPYTPTEVIQVRLGLDTGDPIYKDISTVEEWDDFFRPEGSHANFFENVRITGDLEFKINEDGSLPEGTYLNVKVNRMTGYKSGGSRATISTKKNGSNEIVPIIFKYHGGNLISQAVTEISNLNFENMILQSAEFQEDGTTYKTRWGGNNKGVIGLLQGNLKNVSFTNVTVDGGSSAYVGMVGMIYGEAKNITLKNICVNSNGSYIGGLIGYAGSFSTIDDVTMTADTGKRNIIFSERDSQVGGVVGRLDGILKNVEISSTDVAGREYVGGCIGYASGNGNRPAENKVEHVTVGADSKTAAETVSTPGVINNDPSVTVTLSVKSTTTGNVTACGGAMGYGNNQRCEYINVYNTKVGVNYDPALMTKPELAGDNYGFYAGGIAGHTATQTKNCRVENSTISTPGNYAGGICGGTVSYYNTAVDCVVIGERPGSARIGGIVGSGGAERCITQHCVVSGGENIGGIAGYADGYCRQSGVLDSIIIGKETVGGIGGYDTTYQIYSSYVHATDTSNGTGTAAYLQTEVTSEMLAPQFAGKAGVYTGSYIEGDNNVGGIMGVFRGITGFNLSVGSGVTIKGNASDTGGFFGEFWGALAKNWPTSNRSIYNSYMGAKVIGAAHTGGIMGWYTREEGYNTSLATAAAPIPSQFCGLLITGSVEATGAGNHADLMLGGIDTASLTTAEEVTLAGQYSALTKDYFGYCRVWEGTTVDNTLLTGRTYAYQGSTSETWPATLLVTAADMTNENLYFMPRNTSYGGMGWSREAWSAENMQKLYIASADPSSFETYKSGIETGNMILWLDGKNNTGKGYTDEESRTWTDLSVMGENGNNATLYWNNRGGAEAVNTIAERTHYMFWNDGALEFSGSTNPSYYAQLKNSLSEELNSGNGFTVEVVYSHSNPIITNNSVKFGWVDGGTSGGFGAAFYRNTNSNSGPYASCVDIDRKSQTVYGNLGSGQDWIQHNKTYYRTETYVFDRTGNILKVYQNGVQAGTERSVGKDMIFPDNSNDTLWRIGNVNNYNYFLRISGVRVYDTPLSAEEIAQNAAYDQWYYFGGDKPTGAAAQAAGSITLNADGTVSGGTAPYTLMRSEDGSYSGTVAASDYQGGGLGSRGYYYVKDKDGKYSNIVTKTGAVYGPILRSTDIAGNEYYGVPKNRNVDGQEGRNYTSGTLQNVNDRLYLGGWRLPDYNGFLPWEPAMSAMISLFGLNDGDLPETTAYASGVDTVNLELLSDPEGPLSYEIYDSAAPEEGSKPVLSGTWPMYSRTITMTWDYETPFTLRLVCGEAQRDSTYDYGMLARSVMLYGEGYWYLYGSQCYEGSYRSDEQILFSENPADVFVHMMNGKILDEEGQIWDCESGEIIKSGRKPFRIVKPDAVLWSGQVDNLQVTSYGTYLISEGEDILIKDQSLIFKDGEPYILQDMLPNNFIINKYQNGTQTTRYLTVLQDNGTLRDDYEALTYPENFRYTGIREVADNRNYTAYKPITLIRYTDGTLAGFDYTTGESIPVMTSEASMTFSDFVSESLNTFGLRSLLSGTSGGGLRGLQYESEVAGNYSLRTALANLTGNEENQTPTDGEGSGVYGENIPGGQNGAVTSPGTDKANGSESVIDENQQVIEGTGSVKEGEAVNGSAAGGGTAVSDGTGNGVGTSSGGGSASGTNMESGLNTESGMNTESGDQEAGGTQGTMNEENGSDGSERPEVEGGTAETPDDETEDIIENSEIAQGRYVTVYGGGAENGRVYDLAEYLSTPDDQIVSQEERAKELEKQGFRTTLSTGGELPKEKASGLLLLYLTAAAAVLMLICMAILKRRKLDQKTHHETR